MVLNIIKKKESFYMKNKKWLLLFIAVVICFAMPSIIYLAKNQSIYNFIYQWTFILFDYNCN